MCSAFWHGFYPIYYIMFFQLFLITESSREIYRRRHLYQRIPEKIRSLCNHIYVMCSMNQLGLGFVLLLVSRAITFWNATYWCWILSHLLIVVLARAGLLPKPYKPSKDEQKKRAT
jgi:hypothetical protein